MDIRKMLDMLNEAPYGVYAVDMEQRIVFWNSEAERILGHHREYAVGRFCYEVCASLPENGTAPICIEGCPSIKLARESVNPPAVHVRMSCASGDRKPVAVFPFIVPIDEREQNNLLVHVFDERTTGGDAGKAARNFRDLLSQKGIPPNGESNPLTDRQLEVLRLVHLSLEDAEIAKRLDISPRTVQNHIRDLRARLNARNRLEAVTNAQRLGLLPAPILNS